MQATDIHRYTRPLHVLYAEDSMTMRRATERMLKEFFDHIDTAADGLEASELYKRFYDLNDRYYDIVITDLEMPNMDGQELSSVVLDLNPKQHIIVISSLNDSARLIELMNLGVRKFLGKPVGEEALFNVISDVAKQIFVRNVELHEQEEIEQHNAILKKREKNYLKKLEESHKELEDFNDALNESGVVSKTDPEGIITYVNDRFCQVSGYTHEELIGSKHSIVNSGEMSPVFFSKLWNTITANKIYKGVFKNRSKNGSIYYVESLIKPITDLNGEIVEFISIAHDITLMMDSIETARKAEKAKDEFFINMGHEMRTPLNAIMGLTPLIKRRAKEDTKILGMLDVIEQSGENLHRLIETLLDIQKIRLNTFEINEREFEPHLMLQMRVQNYTDSAHKKQQHFKAYIDPKLPAVLIGDSRRVFQVIDAIADNAIKFTPEGGKIELASTYDTERSRLVIQVKDTGIGIALENQEKIFETSQVDSAANRKHEGAGLGLSLAKKIIQKLGGSITLQSSLDEGSTFTMTFPLKQP